MNRIFNNDYGSLTVSYVTDLLNVSDIHGRDLPPDIKFDLETAEKIALITENYRVQIGIENAQAAYLLLHESPYKARVAKIVELKYTGPNAQEEIERLAKGPRRTPAAWR